MNYFDTSALIKRFVEEAGSQRVADLLRTDPRIAISKIAYAEVHAGLARKSRQQELTADDFRRVARLFDSDWRSCVVVELTMPVLRLTRELVGRHPLRGFDAIHLASAIRLWREVREPLPFVAADHRLLDAARQEGLDVVDVVT